MLRKSEKRLMTRLMQRTVLFLTTYTGGLALFYLFGNVQIFQDSTQFLILGVLSATAILTAILSFILSALILAGIVSRRRKRGLPLFLLGVSCFLFVCVLGVTAHVIVILARGL